jgi:hypothetical protein
MNEKKEWGNAKKLLQIGGGKTLKKQEYHIGIGNQVNINKVVICIMCINPKKML